MSDFIKIRIHDGVETMFTILHVLQFDSERKCMSVIVRNKDDQILLFCKGADNVITGKLRYETENLVKTLEHVKQYAEDGLRVLMIGYKEISEEEYECWKTEYSKAETALEDRSQLVMDCMNKVESGLTMLGVTAVEDRLQVVFLLVYQNL